MLDRITRGAFTPTSAKSELSRPSILPRQNRMLIASDVTVRLRSVIWVVIVIWVALAGSSHLPPWVIPLGVLTAAAGRSSVRHLRIRFL
ncbi:hypothetical protein HUT19_40825 [Streptomyces sp. NA02950]|uniref:hypothetical protein n=1 Tax=Streptomyces sp. NA02950 TaxID=2742137 RepID=UPI0015927C35|nr:hypothetical protein [Streptomyces sp. NA02950]QKV90436.1 hypothetical protein HUT19_00395 [Streptomyces sp. NA02950]QKV97231.1 hypothetical protein HUT19_40825 [Streptomyces sp. NA02950]